MLLGLSSFIMAAAWAASLLWAWKHDLPHGALSVLTLGAILFCVLGTFMTMRAGLTDISLNAWAWSQDAHMAMLDPVVAPKTFELMRSMRRAIQREFLEVEVRHFLRLQREEMEHNNA